MAKNRVKTWIVETLTAVDLNAEFDNLLNDPIDLISPATAALDMDGQELVMDVDGDSSLHMDGDDVLDIKLRSFDAFIFNGSVTSPVNGLTFLSSATGVAPQVMTHGETNVSLNLVTNGSGVLQANGGNMVGTCYNCTVEWTPGDIAIGERAALAVPCPGVVFGDFCLPSSTINPQGATFTADVSSAGFVALTLGNFTTSTLSLGTFTVYVRVFSRL